MGDMLKILVLTCFVVLCAKGDYTVKCNNDSNFETNMSFEPSQDRVKGRYTVVLCTDADENVTEWETLIRFNESIKSEQCNGTYFKQIRRKIRKLWPIHSSSRQNVNFDLACTNACFATSVDLVFEACYIIESILYRGHQSSIPQKIFQYVTNDFPNNTLLLKYTPQVRTTEYKDYVSLNWYISPIPGVAFEMKLCELTTTEHPEHCEDVTQNCTVPELYQIRCRLPPLRGSYSMDLDHYAPWATNIANNKFHWKFRLAGVAGVEEVAVSGGGVWAWAAAGAALALAALALLAWRASPHRPSPAKQRRVLDAWTTSELAQGGGGGRARGGAVRARLRRHDGGGGAAEGGAGRAAAGRRAGRVRGGRRGGGGARAQRLAARAADRALHQGAAAADAGRRLPAAGAGALARRRPRHASSAAGRARGAAGPARVGRTAAAGAAPGLRRRRRQHPPALPQVLRPRNPRAGGGDGAAGDAAAALLAAAGPGAAAAGPGAGQPAPAAGAGPAPAAAAASRRRPAALRARTPRLPRRPPAIPLNPHYLDEHLFLLTLRLPHGPPPVIKTLPLL